jgi:hypothetical protein
MISERRRRVMFGRSSARRGESLGDGRFAPGRVGDADARQILALRASTLTSP